MSATTGVRDACQMLALPRPTFYRLTRPCNSQELPSRRVAPRKLTGAEERRVLEVLHSTRFADKAPQEAYGTLLDEGTYLCSVRTMYRILEKNHEVKERRNQLRHPHYRKPELLATLPNQVWSWDITKLRGPEKWVYFHLYVIIDIFSRYVVGWMVAHREAAELAKRLIEETCRKQCIDRGQLAIHADRGAAMTARTTTQLLATLGVAKSHSRPYTSNDNPFSESQFKTLKYRPDFPDRFGSLEDARSFCSVFFDWYNKEHRHTGIGLMTPAAVHYGLAAQLTVHRQAVLLEAYRRNPERFVRKRPEPPVVPQAVWINPPHTEDVH